MEDGKVADGKPSKDQLDFYFRTSRKYFDELAKEYQTKDPEFYKEHIASYYNNPFKSASGKKAAPVVILGIVLAVAGGGAAFFLTNTQSTTKKSTRTEEMARHEQSTTTENTSKATKEKVSITEPYVNYDSIAVSLLKTDFEKGAYYYGKKDYDAAEEYLNKIGKKDEDYYVARDVLKKIEKERNNRTAKKKPMEKIN